MIVIAVWAALLTAVAAPKAETPAPKAAAPGTPDVQPPADRGGERPPLAPAPADPEEAWDEEEAEALLQESLEAHRRQQFFRRLTQASCFFLPATALLIWLTYVGMLVFFPETGYRLRRRLPFSAERRAVKAELRDLESQLADRDLPHLRYKTARLCLTAGKSGRAVELLGPVLAGEPDHVDALYVLGRALAEQGRYVEALEPLERAAKLKEGHDYGGLQLALARTLAALGRPADAEAGVQRLLAVSRDLPEGLYVLGDILAKEGRRDEARAAWNRCVAAVKTTGKTFRRKNREWLRKARRRLWW